MDRRRLLLLGGAFAATTGAFAAPIEPATIGLYAARLRRLAGGDMDGQFDGAVEDDMLQPHQKLRAQAGLAPLVRRADLNEAARAHAADLLERRYFAHASKEGWAAPERVGLLCRRFIGKCGENIAEIEGGEPPGAASFVELWRTSPGHYENLMRASWTAVGFGVARRGAQTAAVAVFGDLYTELPWALPLYAGASLDASEDLEGARRPFVGYRFAPLGPGVAKGPWRLGEPQGPLGLGAWRLEPFAPDADVPGRYWILSGPIVFGARALSSGSYPRASPW